jgi:Mlc titration factor MtfA (ptsG expression regulator)
VAFRWPGKRSRKKLLETPFPREWEPLLARLSLLRRLDAAQQERHREFLRILVAEKRWEGCAGLQVTETMKVVISAYAALLVVGLSLADLGRAKSILIYPGVFKTPWTRAAGGGIVSEGGVAAGEAWASGGPVVLAWEQVEQDMDNEDDGRNLVLHEFAHRLDLVDGWADGTPVLGRTELYERWWSVLARERTALEAAVETGADTVLDPYGTTNAAEFFAVATEAFFERPADLHARNAELYGLLRDYYRQDPCVRP